MVGKIILYDKNDGQGKVLTEDKKSFQFNIANWKNSKDTPIKGMHISFDIEDNELLNIKKVEDEDEELSEIKLFLDIKGSIALYYQKIDKTLESYREYDSVKGEFEFLKIRRFLNTTYKNLSEMDSGFITPHLREVRSKLVRLVNIREEFNRKNSSPKVAYDFVFLAVQQDYINAFKEEDLARSEADTLRAMAKAADQKKKEKENLLTTLKPKDKMFASVQAEVKAFNKQSVDSVYKGSVLDQRAQFLARLINDFREKYQDEFIELFKISVEEYEKVIINYLNKLAYFFEVLMWEKAKKSEAISGFFEKSGIDGDFSSITYLKYFLKGLNKNQLSHENKKLSILLEHLEESIRKKVLIITKDSYNFKVYKDLLEGIEGKEIIIDGFVSELKALNFVKTYTIDLLIVDEELDQMDVDKFIKDFRKIENIKTHNFKILLMAEQVTREIVAKAKKIKINAILSQDPEEEDFKQKILKLIY